MASFLDGITKDELDVPQKLLFTAGVPVDFEILADFTEFEDNNDVRVEFKMMVLTGENKEKTHLMTVKRSNKKKYVQFVSTFFTDEQMIKGEIKLTDLVGKVLRAMPSPLQEYQGHQFNNWSGYQDVSVKAEELPTADAKAPAPF